MSDSEKSVETQEEVTAPEEPKAEEETKITVTPPKKEKDPKRVAQGKRLAQISKAAKEKKMRDKIAEETQIDFSLDYRSLLYFGVPCVVFAGLYLYLSHKNQLQVHYSPVKKSPQKSNETKNDTRKVVSFFD